jgi:hypothetical protein
MNKIEYCKKRNLLVHDEELIKTLKNIELLKETKNVDK